MKRWMGAIAIGVAGVAGVSAASTTACTSSSPPPTAPSDDPIVIGVSDSLTGGLRGIGMPLQNSIRVAEQYINSLGGILGRRVRYVVQDDQSDEGDIVLGTVQSLLDQRAAVIIGPNGSGQVSAVIDTLTQKQVLEISATATSTALTRPGAFFFRTVPPDNFQAKAVLAIALAGPSGLAAIGSDAGTSGNACPRMALLYYTNTYGTAMADVIKPAFAKAGGTIVADVPVEAALAADYRKAISTIVNATPDCLAMIVYDDVGDAFLRQLAATTKPAGWKPGFFIIGTDGVYTNDFLVNGRADKTSPDSPTVAEGVYGTNPNTNPQSRPEYNDFKNLYLSQFTLPAGQTDLDAYAANEFDAAILAALAIEKAGGTDDKVKLRDALVSITTETQGARGPKDLVSALRAIREGEPVKYLGASGDLTLTEDGNVLGGYIVWHVKNGKFETLAEISPSP